MGLGRQTSRGGGSWWWCASVRRPSSMLPKRPTSADDCSCCCPARWRENEIVPAAAAAAAAGSCVPTSTEKGERTTKSHTPFGCLKSAENRREYRWKNKFVDKKITTDERAVKKKSRARTWRVRNCKYDTPGSSYNVMYMATRNNNDHDSRYAARTLSTRIFKRARETKHMLQTNVPKHDHADGVRACAASGACVYVSQQQSAAAAALFRRRVQAVARARVSACVRACSRRRRRLRNTNAAAFSPAFVAIAAVRVYFRAAASSSCAVCGHGLLAALLPPTCVARGTSAGRVHTVHRAGLPKISDPFIFFFTPHSKRRTSRESL